METSCRYSTVPRSELDHRIPLLQQKLAAHDMDGALIIDRTDLFYYSGTGQQGWLYVPVAGEPLLMIFKEYARACVESEISTILSISGSRRIPETIEEHGLPLPRRLGMEFDVLPVAVFHQYQHIFADADISDISTEIRLLRAVKSDYEIDRIRAAAVGSDALAEKAKEILQVGKPEIVAAGEIEGYARTIGHQGLMKMRLFNNGMSFGHLMSGASAAVPSYAPSPNGGCGTCAAVGLGAGAAPLEANVPILLDYAFGLDGYISDHTRIFCLGTLPAELQRAHDAMLTIQEKGAQLCLPGAIAGEVYQQLLEEVKRLGFADFFMGAGERPVRFIGHGTGLELDEFPFIAHNQKLKLAAGMVLALEPKVVLPGKGIVGIENTNVITDTGLRPLGSFPDAICTLPC